MWLKWLPWKLLIRQYAKKHGFMDPISLWSVFQRFSQPSEVAGPIELIRDSTFFHARGLINSRAIPHNPDWVWPWWIARQFDPNDAAFLPRAFSLTYINLTHRNWTAVGVPGCDLYPIVDPAGLVTPNWNGWSMDAWLLDKSGRLHAPSQQKRPPHQQLEYDNGLWVVTRYQTNAGTLTSRASVVIEDGRALCRIQFEGQSASGDGQLVIALRPYNPEGISFIHDIHLHSDHRIWTLNKKQQVQFNRPMEAHSVSRYKDGDVSRHLQPPNEKTSVICNVGLASAAALFRLGADRKEVCADIPLVHAHPSRKTVLRGPLSWQAALKNPAGLNIPDKTMQFLYEAALRTLILHTPGPDTYPGPFTYKRFWFRDASFILYALLCANLPTPAERVLSSYPRRQKNSGYFQSQHGEWDSNGQVLWIVHRYCRYTDRSVPPSWLESIRTGAAWICRKRLKDTRKTPHSGLMPAGFSAEHFGPNDFYYWDDFWSIAGLRCAAEMLGENGHQAEADRFNQEADALLRSVETSLEHCRQRLGHSAMPISPYRRMDSGAIGSLAAGYPLQVFDRRDRRLQETADYLVENCLHKGGFFLDISHSGINPYLTLHLAQVLMQARDTRFVPLLEALVRLASPTGQWPEAVHPVTEGGCMGDGQHVWAAAEWVLMMRNAFVYEDLHTQQLILGAGLQKDWLAGENSLTFGPAPTLWGTVQLTIRPGPHTIEVSVSFARRNGSPELVIEIPGLDRVVIPKNQTSVFLTRSGKA